MKDSRFERNDGLIGGEYKHSQILQKKKTQLGSPPPLYQKSPKTARGGRRNVNEDTPRGRSRLLVNDNVGLLAVRNEKRAYLLQGAISVNQGRLMRERAGGCHQTQQG